MSHGDEERTEVGIAVVDDADLEEGEVIFEGDETPRGGEAVKLRQRCTELEEEAGRLKELYLRKLADFDNYRKRQEREMEEFKRVANAGLLRDCLPVLDNLERALSTSTQDASGLRTGIELVLKQFKNVLSRYGLVDVDPMGQPFDPTHHEAIQRRETEGVQEPTVVQVMQKGYLLGDRLLRPALVVVAVPLTSPAAPGAPASSAEAPLDDPFTEDSNG
jgi:molecular chaperone GrpE